jgi:hypothetical protein
VEKIPGSTKLQGTWVFGSLKLSAVWRIELGRLGVEECPYLQPEKADISGMVCAYN